MELHDLDLNKLHVFFAVVAEGGVGRAARRLGRTSSAVSQSLGALERALGTKLFDRVGKSLVLTRGGQALHATLQEVHARLARSVAALAEQDGPPRGLVRVGFFLGFPRSRLAALAQRFGAEFPEATLRIVFAPQDDLEERLRRNRLDFVFSFRPRSDASSGLVSTELFAQELVLIASPELLSGRFAVDALERLPVVDYYQSDPLLERWLAHHFPGTRVRPRYRFFAATTDLVLELVVRGAGVGVVPRDVASAPLRARTVAVLGPKTDPLVDRIWLNEPRGAYRDATLEAFRRLVTSELATDRPGPSRSRSSRPGKDEGAPPRSLDGETRLRAGAGEHPGVAAAARVRRGSARELARPGRGARSRG